MIRGLGGIKLKFDFRLAAPEVIKRFIPQQIQRLMVDNAQNFPWLLISTSQYEAISRMNGRETPPALSMTVFDREFGVETRMEIH